MDMMLLKIVLITVAEGYVQGHLRVCYYSNSAQYRPEPARMTPRQINPTLCTHIIYAFARLNENSEIAFTEPRDTSLIEELNELKRNNPSFKTLLAVGGYNQGSTGFSDLAADRGLHKDFARKTVQFLNEWGFDGLDLNWEFPAGKGGRRSADKKNYILLIKELSRQFKAEYYKLMLTAAIPSHKVLLRRGYDLEEMSRHLDFISLMTYDFHGDWERVAGHNSPLHRRGSESTADQEKNVDFIANYVVSQNVPKDKLVIGLPAYGRSYRLAKQSVNSIGARIRGPGPRQPYTNEYGFLAYNEVCKLIPEGEIMFEPEQKVPYLLHGVHWMGYDDVKSFEFKLKYTKDNGYAGAMVWSIDMDDFDGLCPDFTQTFPLVRTMREMLNDDDIEDAVQYGDQYDDNYGDQYGDQY